MAESFKDLSGQVLKGYELQELIGRGGFGAVYRAYQPLIERDVAIKIILPEYANHPNFVRRFETEAQFIARLEHIHIVPLYDYWREPDTACLVMRWLRGGSLQDSIDANGAWNVQSTANLIDQLAAALTTAHRAGIIHRDLKPANVLLDEENNAYLADFGIAKNLIAEPDNNNEEERFGSPAYISPEQVTGQPVSAQTDIYSLGVVIYMMLTGRTPFLDPSTTTVIRRHLNEPLPPLQTVRSDLPHGLNLIIWRATSKRPEERYPDALSLAADFRRVVQSDTPHNILATPSPAPTAPRMTLSPLGQTLPVDLPLEPENPYKGLRAFQEADARDFFGRKSLIGQIAKRLVNTEADHRFLAVVGPSGSGKSSVVRAGLIPSLKHGMVLESSDWFFAQITPGSQPFLELEAALLRVAVESTGSLVNELKSSNDALVKLVNRLLPANDGDLFILIDQFEEIFTQVSDESERARFLNTLVTAIKHPNSRVRIVITLRADFYDRPLLYPEFGELIRNRTEIILPLTSTEMEQAIVGPADRIGMRFEPGLVSAIVSDINQQPGSLPLLQFALTELFERREGYNLTQAAYTASGGVLGALARRADELYDQLDTVSQELARQLFLRLVSLGDGTEDTKRRILQSEFLNAIPENKQIARNVLDTFLKQRLLTADFEPQTRTPTVEIAHEALIRTWGQLRNWLDSNRDALRLHQRLTAATTEWLNTSRDSSFLATGARLSQFETMLSANTLPLAAEENEYISASVVARQRSATRVRLFIAGLIVFSIAALALAIFAFDRQQAAEIERSRADTQANISRSRELAVTALTGVNQIDLALLLSLEALDAAETFEGRNSLISILQSQPHVQKYLQGATGAVRSLEVSPDGNMIVSGGTSNLIFRWDTHTGQPIGEPIAGHTGWINDIAFSHDGTFFASASADSTVRLWDANTGQAIGEPLSGHTGAVWSVVFSPDGKTLASAGMDTSIILWDVDTHQMIGEPLTGHEDIVYALAFNDSGNILASGSGDSTIRLWEVSEQPSTDQIIEAPNWVLSLSFSPVTGLLASTGADTSVTFWDIATGEALNSISTGHTNYIRSLAFSADGRYFATGSQDGTIRLWDARSGDAVGTPLNAHTSPIWSVSFLPQNNTLASADAGGQIILWNISSSQPLSTVLMGHDDDVLSVAFNPDGTSLVSGGGNLGSNEADNTVRLWELSTGEVLQSDEGHQRYVSSVAFSPDGTVVASGSADQTIHLWNLDTSTVQALPIPERSDWVAIAFAPNGQSLAVGTDSGRIYLWDVTTGQLLAEPFDRHVSGILSLSFSPDGQFLASGSDDHTVIIWDVSSRQPRYEPLAGHQDAVTTVAFSPDGRLLASGGHDAVINLWNVSTGQPIGLPLRGHSDWISGIAFSPDAQLLASVSYDQSLFLWDMSRAERLGNAFNGHTSWINTIAFSPDGQKVATGSHDRTIRLWDVGLQTWKVLACDIANRNLTTTEWERYFPDTPYHATC